MTEAPETKQQSDEFIVHWAQWFAITYWQLLGTPAGTNERRRAYKLHTQAGETLVNSTGITHEEAHHG